MVNAGKIRFTGKKLQSSDYEETAIDTDDFGAVLLRLGNRACGSFSVSQMSAGCKNRFQFEIYGTKSGVAWNQERPDELWIGQRNSPNQVIVKDPSLLEARAATFADLPGGHSEGYDDTHKQMFRRFYARVAMGGVERGQVGERCEVCRRPQLWILQDVVPDESGLFPRVSA